MTEQKVDFDREDAIPASDYEDLARRFIPGYDGLYSLTRVLLADSLPDAPEILVVGAGGGKELTMLGATFPNACLLGVDPSEKMLSVARESVERADLSSRIELQQGFVADVRKDDFDAATAIMVMHFIPEQEKAEFLEAIRKRLRPGGMFVIADGCFDKKDEDSDWFFRNYRRHAELKGISPDMAEQAVQAVTEQVFFISPERELELLREAGFKNVKSFFQGLWVRAWIAEK